MLCLTVLKFVFFKKLWVGFRIEWRWNFSIVKGSFLNRQHQMTFYSLLSRHFEKKEALADVAFEKKESKKK
jgi:hypothetical protein